MLRNHRSRSSESVIMTSRNAQGADRRVRHKSIEPRKSVKSEVNLEILHSTRRQRLGKVRGALKPLRERARLAVEDGMPRC
jgi:hypothetical protein